MRVHDHGFPAYISSTSPAASRKAGRSGAQKRGFTARRPGQGALETKAEPMASHRRPDDPRNEPIYRAILAVLAASVLAGAVLALAGDALFGSRALATAGFGLAVVRGGFHLEFRLIGRRAARAHDAGSGSAHR